MDIQTQDQAQTYLQSWLNDHAHVLHFDNPHITPLAETPLYYSFTFSVSNSPQTYHVKMSKPEHLDVIQHEAYMLRFLALQQVPFVPEYIYYSFKPRFLVTTFIPGTQLLASSDLSSFVDHIAQTLAGIHAIPLREYIDHFKRDIVSAEKIGDLIPDLPERFRNVQVPMTITHNDLLPEHIIQNEQSAYIIGWSKGNVNMPYIDLAALFGSTHMSIDHQTRFLETYHHYVPFQIDLELMSALEVISKP